MPTWEEIFTSSNPAGGRMINVISGVAGSEASPYTADNPSGGRAINVNLIGGGSVATGVLQLNGGAPLDTTLRSVTDQANTVSPLQLSTTQVAVGSNLTNLVFQINSIAGTSFQGSSSNTRFGFAPSTAFLNFVSTAVPYVIGTFSGSDLVFGTNNSEGARLVYNGSGGGGSFVIGHTSASARLHVRGDGTNPITRFEATDGVLFWSLNSTATIQRMGGTTNAFPAIKRNGAAIDFRLADDSGYADVRAAIGDFVGYSLGATRFRLNNGTVYGNIGYVTGVSNGIIQLTNAAETDFSKLHFGPTTKPAVCQGSGTPEGAVTAPVGSVFMRSDGGAATSFYVKESGTGNTGWVAK